MNPDTTFAVITAPKRDSRHWKPGTVTWSEICGWMKDPSRKKECGNYLLGTIQPTTVAHDRDKPDTKCLEMHRRKDAVVSRSAITLDIDYAKDSSFAEAVELAFPYAAVMHTTYSSSPDAPRYRMIIPTDREITPDEYVAAARALMGMLGSEAFDPGSEQAERYMFKPAVQQPEWFQYWLLEGETVVADDLLKDFEEDLSSKPIPAPSRFKRDPFEIEGVIGAFNRAYEDWDLLIEEYELPYEKVDADRYHLVGSRSQAGMGPVRDVVGFMYSHHANDPAYGKTCSAFDLVRLHKFGELDEGVNGQTPVNKLPSHLAMLDVASTDYRVTAQLVGVDFAEDMEDSAESQGWKLGLRLAQRSGKFLDTIANWDLLRGNDPAFRVLGYNRLSLSPEATGDLPWRKVTPEDKTFSDTDRWSLVYHIERVYGIRPSKPLTDSLVDMTSREQSFNPILEYLESLVWDGKERVETCLPGVRPTEFTKKVARMVMAAAAARMFDPGCKWDHTLVLYGTEGIGKSWWIDKLAQGYSSSLGRIDNKDTLLVMQRSWIMTADEGHSLRKVDSDAMKEFLTRGSDVFRLPYDRETLVHPRHSVIWSTTNDETFLRRQDGNRRFLIVHCQDRVDFDGITKEYVDQLWAEAVYMYKAGEQLFMSEESAGMAAIERERFTEEDSIGGIIQEYLDQLVPANWWKKSPQQRIQWMSDRDHGFELGGEVRIDRVCSSQIWVEALGRRLGDHRRVDLLDITEAIKRIPGWTVSPRRHHVPGYGPQLVFFREEDLL